MGYKFTLCRPDGELFGEAEYSHQPDVGDELIISGNRRVRQVDTSGTITTVVGTGSGGSGGFSGDGGPPQAANIGSLGGLAFDSAKRLVISCATLSTHWGLPELQRFGSFGS